MASSSFNSFLLSILTHPFFNFPLFLGKSPDGTFPLWSLLLFAPLLFLIRVFTAIRRFCSGESPYDEITPGLFVGGWPDAPHNLPPGNPAVIDCTCELPRRDCVARNAYLCIPAWDKRAPRPDQIQAAVDWARPFRARKVPVFIHCAYGHGRSVTVMCAVLVAFGVAKDWKNAEEMIKEKRPGVNLNHLHRNALEEWSNRHPIIRWRVVKTQ